MRSPNTVIVDPNCVEALAVSELPIRMIPREETLPDPTALLAIEQLEPRDAAALTDIVLAISAGPYTNTADPPVMVSRTDTQLASLAVPATDTVLPRRRYEVILKLEHSRAESMTVMVRVRRAPPLMSTVLARAPPTQDIESPTVTGPRTEADNPISAPKRTDTLCPSEVDPCTESSSYTSVDPPTDSCDAPVTGPLTSRPDATAVAPATDKSPFI